MSRVNHPRPSRKGDESNRRQLWRLVNQERIVKVIGLMSEASVDAIALLYAIIRFPLLD